MIIAGQNDLHASVERLYSTWIASGELTSSDALQLKSQTERLEETQRCGALQRILTTIASRFGGSHAETVAIHRQCTPGGADVSCWGNKRKLRLESNFTFHLALDLLTGPFVPNHDVLASSAFRRSPGAPVHR